LLNAELLQRFPLLDALYSMLRLLATRHIEPFTQHPRISLNKHEIKVFPHTLFHLVFLENSPEKVIIMALFSDLIGLD
jgi:hypothetical protein